MENLTTSERKVIVCSICLFIITLSAFSQTLRLNNANVLYPWNPILPIEIEMPIATYSIDALDLLEGTTWEMDYREPVKQNLKKIGTLLFEKANFAPTSTDNKYALYSIVKGQTTSGGIISISTKVTTQIAMKWIFVQNKDTLLVLENIYGSGTTKIGNMFDGKGNAKSRMEQAVQNVFRASCDTLYKYINFILEYKKENPSKNFKNVGLNIALKRSTDGFDFKDTAFIEQTYPDELLLDYLNKFKDSPLTFNILSKLEANHALDANFSFRVKIWEDFEVQDSALAIQVTPKLDSMKKLHNNIMQSKIINYKNKIGTTTEEQFWADGWNFEDPDYGILGITGFDKTSDKIIYYLGIDTWGADEKTEKGRWLIKNRSWLSKNDVNMKKQAFSSSGNVTVKVSNTSINVYSLTFEKGILTLVEKLKK